MREHVGRSREDRRDGAHGHGERLGGAHGRGDGERHGDGERSGRDREAPVMPPSKAAAPAKAPSRPEAEILQEAQQALGSDPNRALTLCAEHAQDHPGGALSQEREVISIDALVRLGRTDEARARADAFRRRHPTSGHNRRLDVLLGTP